MRQNTFVPPPRSVDDIVSVLNQPGHFDKRITESLAKKASEKPPKTDNPSTLAEFYRDRSKSAKELGQAGQELVDIRKAMAYARKAKGMTRKGMSNLLKLAGNAEIRLGNFKKGQALYWESLALFPTASSYHLLAEALFKTGDFKGGTELVEEGVAFCNNLINKSAKQRAGRIKADKARLNAIYFTSLGKHKKAEAYWREFQHLLIPAKAKKPALYLKSHYYLAKSMKSQGLLVKAELEIRKGLKGAIAHAGKNTALTATMANLFGEILLKQGRLDDAEKLFNASLECYRNAGILETSMAIAAVKKHLGETAFGRGDFKGSLNRFMELKESMAANQYLYNSRVRQNMSAILCFLISGSTMEAEQAVSFFFNNLAPYYGARQYKTAEMTAIRGIVHFKKKRDKQALHDFTKAIPALFREKGDEGDYLKNYRRRLIIESFMDLLVEILESGREKEFKINISSRIFDLCERLNNSVLEGALGASGARAAAVAPDLADLVRKEQDATKQINAIKRSLTNLAAAGSGEMDKTALATLKADLKALKNAKKAFLTEIEKRFPKYAEFINPQPKTFSHIQEILNPGEAMVIIYPFSSRTFVWGVPRSGEVSFKVARTTTKELVKNVAALRRSLAPDPKVFGDIPQFDLSLAHTIFTTLLEPVGSAWKHAGDLLIVAPGSLGQIPFGILPTDRTSHKKEKSLLYDNYREIPWLIKKVSITRIPSVSALATLRSLPDAGGNRKPFVGFGDPIFNLAQLSEVKKSGGLRSAKGGFKLRVRGIRKIEKKGAQKKVEKVSIKISDLSRLPDTADEIISIAGVMGADMKEDVFLNRRATETHVKTIDLLNRKIIAFASHGLIPMDLDGLVQPAIALTAPEVTGNANEDGLLTMGEILKLNLNADWVILSACNTGAGEGEGAEAVSGLGRSFFYAGTRALLVTMWPVETTSAKELTTGLFKYSKANPELSRARSLQASIVNLIENEVIQNPKTGQPIASYAHPFFWAPFIVVGDGG